MDKQVAKSFTWVIPKFKSVQSEYIYSDVFVVDGCNWRLLVYPKGKNKEDDYLSMHLEVADHELLPCGWRRHAKFSLGLNTLSWEAKANHLFDLNSISCGFPFSGFPINGRLKDFADVDVLEVIKNSDLREETLSYMEVNGFQVLPSQVKPLNRLLEKHPEIAKCSRMKNILIMTYELKETFSAVKRLMVLNVSLQN